MLLSHPFSINIKTPWHYYFLIDNYLLIGKSFVSIWSVYFRYIFCIWYFKLFSFVYVFTASVYFQFIIRIWNPELYALILCQFILVYFLDIFGIWSCTCIFFIPFKKARIFDFHLVSFDFSFGIIWFQLNQVNFTWLIACNFF